MMKSLRGSIKRFKDTVLGTKQSTDENGDKEEETSGTTVGQEEVTGSLQNGGSEKETIHCRSGSRTTAFVNPDEQNLKRKNQETVPSSNSNRNLKRKLCNTLDNQAGLIYSKKERDIMSTPIDQETLKHNAGAVQQNACKKVKTDCRNELHVDSTPNLGVISEEMLQNRSIKSDLKMGVERSREMNINPQKDKTSIQNVRTDAHQGQPEPSQSVSLPPGLPVSGQPKGGDLDLEDELVRRPESAPPLLEQTLQTQDNPDEGVHENIASCQTTHQQKDDRNANLEEKFVELQNQFVKETEEKEALKTRLDAAEKAIEAVKTKCEQLEIEIHKFVCCKTATLGGTQGLTMSAAAQITEDTPGAGKEQTTQSTSPETTASLYPTTGVKRSTKITVPFFQRAPRSPVFGADQNFLNEVISGLKDCGIMLEQENLENMRPMSSAPLILFCLQSSRLGTDVDQALREYKGAQLDIILIVMRHLPRHARRFTPTQQILPRHPQVKLTVDIVFWETEGFYQCEENQEAIVQVISYFQHRALNQSDVNNKNL